MLKKLTCESLKDGQIASCITVRGIEQNYSKRSSLPGPIAIEQPGEVSALPADSQSSL